MTDDRILNQARRELDMPRHAGYILTGAELKRRLYLINHEKNQLNNQPTNDNQKELFQ